MKMTRLLAPTLREDPAEADVVSQRLMLRGGMIRRLAAGVYTFLPLGQRVLHKVTTIIREEMNATGAQEILMPTLLPAELWQETGRWDLYGKELFRVKDRHERDFCLGPTHEEIITDLVRANIKSYKQLPVTLYQIQTKFRDEIRPRFGIMRGREFLMKDAYSFHDSEASLDIEYQKMHAAYCRIFDRMGLKYIVKEADSGLIGGGFSQEFMVIAEAGEEELENGARGIEVGHIFKLGTKYSDKMNARYLDENNTEHPYIMGCYGIGVTRTAAAAIEQSHDKDGIIWPEAIAPYLVVVVPANSEDSEQMQAAETIYNDLTRDTRLATRDEVVLDDRPGRLGMKLKDADLIGFPYKVIVGKALKEGKVEIKLRKTGEIKLVETGKVGEELEKCAVSLQ